MKVLFCLFAVISVSFASPKFYADEPQCKSPNGKGLQPVLAEFVGLLPMDDIMVMVLTALSDDEEVQTVMEYLQSDKFKSLVVHVQKSSEFQHILDYSCKTLYLDAYYYLNVLGGILGLPPLNRPSLLHVRDAANLRSGLNGLLEDILDILPVAELKKLFEEKMASDEYLQLAMKAIASQEFQDVFKVLHAHEELDYLLNAMRGMGVDVDAIIAGLKKFFNWG